MGTIRGEKPSRGAGSSGGTRARKPLESVQSGRGFELPADLSGPKVSVVLPIYDEVDTVQVLIPEIVETLSSTGMSFEIIAIDDGSQDETLKVLRALQSEYPGYLRLARHVYNKGNGAALRTGVRVARGEILVSMDADGQHTPGDIPALVSQIPPFDLVVGARMEGYQGGWHRKAANWFYNRFASWLSRKEVLDLTSGFRAMRRSVVLHFLPLFPDGFSAPTTTSLAFLKAGYNVAFVPIHIRQRAAGRSKIKLWEDGTRFVLIILRMIMLYDPLRIFLPTSVGLGFLGTAAEIAGLLHAKRLVLANSAILLFIAALMTWLLGLIASQISSSVIYYHGDETIVMEERPDEPPGEG